jgi:hypothetical protein
MTEEQRYQQKIKIDSERNKCLKGIWDELKDIRQALTAIALGKTVKDEELADLADRITRNEIMSSDCSTTQYRANGEHDDYIPSNNCESDACDWERAKEKPVEGWK